MPRPIPLSPLVQDLLTITPDLPDATGTAGDQGVLRPPRGAVSGSALPDRPTPFTPKVPLPRGRTFTPQDPLGLAAPPQLATGEDPLTLPALADQLSGILRMPCAITLSSWEAAIQAAIGAAIKPGDTVILDAALYSAMLETVLTLQAHPLRTPPASVAGVERRLRRLNSSTRTGRIWVAVPALSLHASTMADMADLADLCHHHGAGLIVDVTQDLGLVGQDGGGVMEVQGCLGRADVVVGGFARAFGAPGGFVACRDHALYLRLHQPQMRHLLPCHAATILSALDRIEGPQGQRRRRSLHALSLRLRNHLMADGVPILGQASPIVPVRLAPRTALACTALMHSAGVGVRLLQAPSVAGNVPRWCLHLTADHTPADIDSLADLIRDVTRALARR